MKYYYSKSLNLFPASPLLLLLIEAMVLDISEGFLIGMNLQWQLFVLICFCFYGKVCAVACVSSD